MNKKQINRLIIISVFGFSLLVSGIVAYFLTSNIFSLIPLVLGCILSLFAHMRSQIKEKTPTLKSTPTLKQNDTQELVFKPRYPEPLIEENVVPIIETPEKDSLDAFIPLYEKETLSVKLRLNNDHAEALVTLIEKMEQNNLMKHNPAFDKSNSIDDVVYRDTFEPIPVIGLVANRHQNYNVLAGLTHSEVDVIGTFNSDDLDSISKIYPNTLNIVGLISGGKYRSIDQSTHDHPYQINLTFYT